MRILVTGGAGFIGSHAALRLLDEGHDVVVVDNLFRGHQGAIQSLAACGGPRFRFAQGSICDGEFLSDVFARERPDAVMHFAALAYVGESVEREDYRYVRGERGDLLRVWGWVSDAQAEVLLGKLNLFPVDG